MKTFFTSLLLIGNFCNALAQQPLDDFELTDKELLNSIRQFNQNQLSLSNARTMGLDPKYLLDTINRYTYVSESDSIPFELTKYYPNEYGHDTLIITYRWSEQLLEWKNYTKEERSIAPIGASEKNKYFTWNGQQMDWVCTWDLRIYRNEFAMHDSTISFSYTDTGILNYAYKILNIYSEDGNHVIRKQINFDIATSEWKNDNRTETYLNSEGNIDLEIRERWDDITNSFVLSEKLEYNWDSIGFDLIVLTLKWDNNLSSWVNSQKSSRVIIDENGSTERLQQRWDVNSESWEDSRIVFMLMNDIGRLTSFGSKMWFNNLNKWHPVFEANWEYDPSTGLSILFVNNNNWDSTSSKWMDVKIESYSYDSNSLLSRTHIYLKNVETNSLVLVEKAFRTYSQKDIITKIPGTAFMPVGTDTLCINSENTTYKTFWGDDIKSFQWRIIPEEAGTLKAVDSLVIIDWAVDYSGQVGLAVAGVNGFGIGAYSDTLDVFIMTPPSQPSSPVGPDLLNQFSGVVEYEVEIQEETDEYIWSVDPEEAGELTALNNVAEFQLTEDFEGLYLIAIQTNNRCGLSALSEPLSGIAEKITGLDDEIKVNTLNIYPNPTDGYFTINSEDFDHSSQIKIINVNGSLVWQSNKLKSIKNQGLNLNLYPGIYFVMLETVNGIASKKLLVQ